MTSIATERGSHVLVGVQVTHTWFVVPAHARPYFRIEVAATVDEPPAVLLTRDRALYRAALDAEGTAERLEVEWAPRSREGKAVRELVAIRRGV